MLIEDVKILNWQDLAGDEWWTKVRAKPYQDLIYAQITLRLSWKDYQKLIERARQTLDGKPCLT